MDYLRIYLILLCTVLPLTAEIPAGNLGIHSLGVSYNFEMTGFTIPDGRESSALQVHLSGLHYAPVPYIMFTMKFGAGNAVNQDTNLTVSGDYGFAFKGGASFYSPEFTNILRITGGSYFTRLQSPHIEKGTYTANISNSHLGVIIEALSIIDFELGFKYCYTSAETTQGLFSGFDTIAESYLISYGQFTIHSSTGAFLVIGGDFSPEFTTDNEGIYNGSFLLSVGTVMKHRRRGCIRKNRL